jgi:hypothetical protein
MRVLLPIHLKRMQRRGTAGSSTPVSPCFRSDVVSTLPAEHRADWELSSTHPECLAQFEHLQRLWRILDLVLPEIQRPTHAEIDGDESRGLCSPGAPCDRIAVIKDSPGRAVGGVSGTNTRGINSFCEPVSFICIEGKVIPRRRKPWLSSARILSPNRRTVRQGGKEKDCWKPQPLRYKPAR